MNGGVEVARVVGGLVIEEKNVVAPNVNEVDGFVRGDGDGRVCMGWGDGINASTRVMLATSDPSVGRRDPCHGATAFRDYEKGAFGGEWQAILAVFLPTHVPRQPVQSISAECAKLASASRLQQHRGKAW